MNGRHPLGTVAQLWRYPIKSLQAESLERAAVERDGLVGDRRRALFVATAGHARDGRTYRGKEHHLLHTVASADDARELASARETALAERGDGPFFDAEPVSIVFDRWVRALEALVGCELDPQRFRPNLYVRGEPDFDAEEADLVGRTLAIGDTQLEVVSEIERCVTITYDVETGEPLPHALRELALRRDNVMGIYARTIAPGTLARGDAVFALA